MLDHTEAGTDDSLASYYTVVCWYVPGLPPVEIMRTEDKLAEFYESITDPLDLDSYTTDTATDQTFCKCTEEENQAGLHCNRRRLREPEYSLTAKVKCEGLRLLPCDAEGVTQLLDKRRNMPMQFLRKDELLYLLLINWKSSGLLCRVETTGDDFFLI